MADLKVESLVNQLKEMIEKNKRDKKEKEMIKLLKDNINIILKRNTTEYSKCYNIRNVKIVFKLLIKIIKKQSKDIQELKNKLI